MQIIKWLFKNVQLYTKKIVNRQAGRQTNKQKQIDKKVYKRGKL